MLRSLEQERANYAWECIQAIKGDIDLEDKYKSYVRSASTYIQTNGLGNTLAFYKSKFEADLKKKTEELKKKGVSEKRAYEEAFNKLSADKKAYRLLYAHIDGWFKKHYKINKEILEWVISKDTSSIKVFQVTIEIISLLNWMKRFAEAELRDKRSE